MKKLVSLRLTLLLTSLLLVVATVSLTLILMAKGAENIRNQYLRSLETRSRLFHDGIRESLLSGDYPTVIQKSRLLNEQDDVQTVRVQLEDGSEIASFAKDNISKSPSHFSTHDTVYIENHWNAESTKNVYGSISIDYDLRRLNAAEAKIFSEVLVVGAILLTLMALFLWLFSRYILGPISKLQRIASEGDLPGFSTLGLSSRLREINDLQKALSNMSEGLLKAEQTNREFAVISAVAETSRQVAHDIRSPLSALNMVSSYLKDLPEDQRMIVRNATQRINDIANQLLARSGKTNSNQESVMLVTLLDAVVSEKRVQIRDRMDIEIEATLNSGYGLFCSIEGSELSRIISNLINNSVESIAGNGKIEIDLALQGKKIVISVRDNGKGIPSHILTRLGERGISFGKEGTESGSGLGIHHAKRTVETIGGNLTIESELDKGTTVRISLPRGPAPSWFVDKLPLDRYSRVVSLDDDQTIHQIWEKRFKSLSSSPTYLSFFSLKKLEDFVASESEADSLFLVDYELLGQKENGLDIIERLGIAAHSILVTSHFNEAPVRKRAQSIGVKIIPKSLTLIVPLE